MYLAEEEHGGLKDFPVSCSTLIAGVLQSRNKMQKQKLLVEVIPKLQESCLQEIMGFILLTQGQVCTALLIKKTLPQGTWALYIHFKVLPVSLRKQ